MTKTPEYVHFLAFYIKCDHHNSQIVFTKSAYIYALVQAVLCDSLGGKCTLCVYCLVTA